MTVVWDSPALAPAGERARGSGNKRVAWVAIAFVLPLLYAAYTHHVWEDYLITFRQARNGVLGLGLTYNPPERVHGFTSPIGVLLPAFFYRITGAGDALAPALWAFRLASAAAFAGSVACFTALVTAPTAGHARGTRPRWIAALPLLLLLDLKSVAFSANGQETGFLLLFLAAALRELTAHPPAPRILPLALAITGLQWTRPDAFILAGALCIAAWRFSAPDDRRAVGVRLIQAITLAVILYLPWVAFTWAYYGSPVPHTIRAKSSFLASAGDVTNLYAGLWAPLLDLPNRMAAALMPVYASMGGWPAWTQHLAQGLTIGAGLYWLLPTGDRTGRVASLAFLLISVYFCYIPLYPWYLPPAGLLALVVIARAVQRPDAFGQHGRVRAGPPLSAAQWLPPAMIVGVVAWQTFLSLAGTHALRLQQSIIEDGVRTQVGLWLKNHVRPAQTVYTECLGYVGYFSGARVLDWPGLVSPEVLRVRTPFSRMHTLVPRLRPDFIVARPGEAIMMRGKPYFTEHYARVKTFDARDRLAEHGAFYGRAYAEYDAVFEIYELDAGTAPGASDRAAAAPGPPAVRAGAAIATMNPR